MLTFICTLSCTRNDIWTDVRYLKFSENITERSLPNSKFSMISLQVIAKYPFGNIPSL